MAARKPCQKPGCPALVGSTDRFCEKHLALKSQRREKQPHQAMYSLSRWRRGLQPMVIRRDPFCMSGVVCDPDNVGNRAPSEHADHIIPVSERPDLAWDMDNLQGLCPACHSHKTATEDSTFAKKKAA